MLLGNLKEVPHIVPCFDELYNNIITKGQMDVLVRNRDINLKKVNTHYIFSEFMGKAAADDVLANSDLQVLTWTNKKIYLSLLRRTQRKFEIFRFTE